jgi:hypothetical protein
MFLFHFPFIYDRQSQIGSHVFWWDVNGVIKYGTIFLHARMVDVSQFTPFLLMTFLLILFFLEHIDYPHSG